MISRYSSVASHRPPELRMSTENVSPCNQLAGDACSEVGEVLVEERGKPIEIGEGVERPFDLYWPDHGRNRAVPHVRSH